MGLHQTEFSDFPELCYIWKTSQLQAVTIQTDLNSVIKVHESLNRAESEEESRIGLQTRP
jgi:hypothetical protein